METEKRISEKLNAYGLKLEDLTAEELDALKKEIEAEEKGYTVLDGVLFGISPYRNLSKK